jgi:hypothetical protein
MSTQPLEPDQIVPDRIAIAKVWLWLTVVAYAIFALYSLIETLDFLALLHSKPPGESPTYTVVDVMYFLIETVVCTTLALVFSLIKLNGRNGGLLGFVCLVIAFGRWGLAWYLYLYTDPEWHHVPFIHKVGSDFSDPMRVVFLSGQVIVGLISAWYCWRSRAGSLTPAADATAA